MEVETVEQGERVAGVVEGGELRCIEKPLRGEARHREKIADRMGPAADIEVAGSGS